MAACDFTAPHESGGAFNQFEGVSYVTRGGRCSYFYDIMTTRRIITFTRQDSGGNWSPVLQGGIDDFGNLYFF